MIIIIIIILLLLYYHHYYSYCYRNYATIISIIAISLFIIIITYYQTKYINITLQHTLSML